MTSPRTACSNLIVYGSLMSREELETCGVSSDSLLRIVVRGFRRSFGQEPSWRIGNGNQRGVLTVEPTSTGTLNAILISRPSQETLLHLRQRERGYDYHEVLPSQIYCQDSSSFGEAEDANTYIFCGKPELHNPGLEPLADYLQICLAAARQWGTEFYKEFCRTTWVGDRDLQQYLQRIAD